MGELIPYLNDLCFTRNKYEVPEGFAQAFVKLHAEDWRVAQAHWEQIVERVLDTDAVEEDATEDRAMYQAVAATAILLTRTDLRSRCPVCPRPLPAPIGERSGSGRTGGRRGS